jgi:hypothetical protein
MRHRNCLNWHYLYSAGPPLMQKNRKSPANPMMSPAAVRWEREWRGKKRGWCLLLSGWCRMDSRDSLLAARKSQVDDCWGSELRSVCHQRALIALAT